MQARENEVRENESVLTRSDIVRVKKGLKGRLFGTAAFLNESVSFKKTIVLDRPQTSTSEISIRH